jgi:hypothetical protein
MHLNLLNARFVGGVIGFCDYFAAIFQKPKMMRRFVV